MKYRKYSPKGFENIRALSISYAILLLFFALIGFTIHGVGRRFYLLFLSFLASVYLMIPGIIVFTRPWISQAWLHALHPLMTPRTSWDELAVEMKALIVIGSIISLVAGILILVFSILTL